MTTSEEFVADDAGTMKGVEMMGFQDMLDRKRYVVERLEVVSIPDVAKKGSKPVGGNRKKTMKTSAATSRKESDAAGIEKVPFTPKTDTHWDFVMKELMWLGADFQAERKRQRSLAKKCAASVRQYHRTKEARRLRELAQADAKRRKLAARAGREVKAWWNKLDKIIAFKQKMKADEEREKAMNKQLVVLVQQTEKYTESLATYTVGDTSTEDDCSEIKSLSELEEDGEMEGQSTVDEIGGSDRKTSRRKTKLRKRYRMTIEEALASEHRRKSKSRVVDYARMKVDSTEFYGESTASDASGSDDTFSEPDVSDDSDDDSTLRTAMREELEERKKMVSKSSQTNQPFFPDPEEVTKLQEEQTMDIQQVINRLRDESSELESNLDEPAAKRVKFAESINDIPVMYLSRKVDPGEEADDDGDASDVEERNAGDFSDEEYEVGEIEVDDETTIAQEESLPTEMACDEEIDLLRKSAEIPIEELRKMYANLQAQHEGEGSICSESKRSSSESVGDDTTDEDDYVAGEPEIDDEITIAQEESLPQDVSYLEEIDLLKQGAEVPIEELRRMYAHLSFGTDNEEVKKTDGGSSSASDEDGAYEESAVHEVDDETTIEAEERLGRDMTYEEELSALHRDNMMSVEELRAIYGSLDENHLPQPSKERMIVEERDAEPNTQKSGKGKRAREKDDSSGSETDVELDDGVAALNALEASAEKARQTLASRPFLLAPWVKLRMYQQVGLNWLVSLQARRLNGILADEMGLGKTLQTISLLAYLASYKGIWGPHLVVVPTSVIINWETELKRFCPGLKVLCYYGSAKRRKELRTGWTKTNWYHVVITSYQLAVQDAFAFKRKKWYYLILDEAQNIKNFQSQRWQTLINFNTQRRLLLTGTPLQNSLMELWSLLHFLMPYIFKSRKEFSYWFSNPMNSMIEGTVKRNDDVIKRLHGIIRPFVLRRLKKDVETQMPGKYEHIVRCKLSRRQMTLYEEFLSRSSTRQALKKGGNFMGMMNVLMQLRKVCNHPDLFEPRSVVTPFVVSNIRLQVPRCVGILEKRKEETLDKISENLFQPLWTGSSGQPSLGAALRHNLVEARELHRLGTQRDPKLLSFKDEKTSPEELRTTLAEIYVARRQVVEARILFQNNLNRRRCDAPSFIYSSACQEAVDIETSVLHRRGPVEIQRSRLVEIPSPLLALCKSELQRSEDLEETIEKFVFCVPSAGALPIAMDDGGFSKLPLPKSVERMLLEPVEELLLPYRKAFARLSSFFPDKKLVQYDAGKLQTLAELLRTLKHGGHRALIFTQMSKMLDILEVFLNIHGFTYLRLDGATGVDRRQRYMDRFNNDTKIFCFILSTRSGGMGINLTGADTVIFYDSDWNPAMDAQAQDRAHRIGI
ncbi:SNF2-related protein [Nitzschia inconspicua]|uniref:SNF2-related protein n=1 Tax=Nitzschia inconspicua TaxID=303405 RepID=A0A9K3LTY2_9STRA|nr:SNF2-related protein [Nitzschia inconspicua]